MSTSAVHHCKDCSLYFESSNSLDVHLHYHKDNLLSRWAQAAEDNNNTCEKRSPPYCDKRASPMTSPGFANGTSPLYSSPADTRLSSPGFGFGSEVTSSCESAFSVPPAAASPLHEVHRHNGFFGEHQEQQYGYQQPYNGAMYRQGPPAPHQPPPPHQQPPAPPPPHESTGFVSPQCERCGRVCESSAILLEHMCRPPRPSRTPPPPFDSFYPDPPVSKESPGAEILDLDSHKVHVYQPPLEPPPKPPPYQQDKGPPLPLSPPRPFPPYLYPEQLIPPTPPYMHQLPPAGPPPPPPPASNSRGSHNNQSWKTNEARRPKTYNCSACNKWFTSSGHLKRHYNTTLHKNAVKQGAPDPTESEHVRLKPPPPSIPPPNGGDSTSTTPSPAPSMGEESSSRSDDSSFPPHVSSGSPNWHAGPQESPTLAVLGDQTHGGLHPRPPPPLHPTIFTPNHPHPHFCNTNNNITHQIGEIPHPPTQTAPHTLLRENHPGRISVLDIQDTTHNTTNNYPFYPGVYPWNYPPPSWLGPPPSPTESSSSEEPPSPPKLSPPRISTSLHKCLDCDKVFNRACYLTQHNKSFHSGDKPFKCHTCGKRFPADHLFQDHLSKHAGEKPYKCEVCPKQFNHKTDLRRHVCLHSGEKPFSCGACGKGFIRKDHMLKHLDTHRRKLAVNL